MKQMHYLLVGLPFAGKTVLAKELEKRLGFVRLSIDDVKSDMGYEGRSDAEITDETWEKIFAELDRRIEERLKLGKTVINEYAWLTKAWRDRARKLAERLGIKTKIIFVDTLESVVRERWKQNRQTKDRFDVPDDVFEESLRLFEKPTGEENIVLYTTEDTVENLIQRLK